MHKRARNHVWLVMVDKDIKFKHHKKMFEGIRFFNDYKTFGLYEPQGKRLN